MRYSLSKPFTPVSSKSNSISEWKCKGCGCILTDVASKRPQHRIHRCDKCRDDLARERSNLRGNFRYFKKRSVQVIKEEFWWISEK